MKIFIQIRSQVYSAILHKNYIEVIDISLKIKHSDISRCRKHKSCYYITTYSKLKLAILSDVDIKKWLYPRNYLLWVALSTITVVHLVLSFSIMGLSSWVYNICFSIFIAFTAFLSFKLFVQKKKWIHTFAISTIILTSLLSLVYQFIFLVFWVIWALLIYFLFFLEWLNSFSQTDFFNMEKYIFATYWVFFLIASYILFPPLYDIARPKVTQTISQGVNISILLETFSSFNETKSSRENLSLEKVLLWNKWFLQQKSALSYLISINRGSPIYSMSLPIQNIKGYITSHVDPNLLYNTLHRRIKKVPTIFTLYEPLAISSIQIAPLEFKNSKSLVFMQIFEVSFYNIISQSITRFYYTFLPLDNFYNANDLSSSNQKQYCLFVFEALPYQTVETFSGFLENL